MANDTDARIQEYFRLVQLLLLDFQFIEEGLKMYLATAYDIIRLRTRDVVQFELSYDTVAQEPLGRLVSRFAPLTANKELVERLKGLQRERNYCAHQAFLLKETRDAAFLSREVARLESLRQTTRQCVQQVMEEGKSLSQARNTAHGSV